MGKEINITLNKNQAIVLFELVAELGKTVKEHSAEEIVLSEIECALEKQLIEPFDANYSAILNNAKNKLEQIYYINKQTLIDLLENQHPKQTNLIVQLKEMKAEKWLKKPYIRFVNGDKANQQGAEWQFEENIVLEHTTEGTIVLDILKDGRIGGFELLNELD